jgi:glycosyltransferase involved in cell wall biosynthesis
MNNKGTIVYLGNIKLPNRNAAAHRVINNSKIFSKLGYEVKIIGTEINNNNHVNTININNSIKYESLNNYKNLFNHYLSVKKIIGKISSYENVKLIVLYNYPAIPSFKLLKYYRKLHIKVIADCTEWYGKFRHNLLLRILKKFDTFARMRIVNKKLDGLIVISDYLENYYKNQPIVKIPPLIDINDEKWQLNLSNTHNNLNAIRLIYFGNPGEDKDDILLLIKIFIKLENIFFLDVYGINISDLKSIPPKIDLPNNVRFHGFINHELVLNKVKEASFSVFFRNPNSRVVKAGFPTKLVESITCGTPVITVFKSDYAKYLTSAEVIFINDLSPTNVHKELKRVIDDYLHNHRNSNIRKDIFHFDNYINNFTLFFKKININ